jgi:hypothetical protein
MMHHKLEISLSIIGVAAVLMVVTAPTLENQQALAASQWLRKLVSKIPLTKLRKIHLGKDSSNAVASTASESVFVVGYLGSGLGDQ